MTVFGVTEQVMGTEKTVRNEMETFLGNLIMQFKNHGLFYKTEGVQY